MNQRTLKILEYEKIIQKLVDLAQSSLGKNLAEKLVPSINEQEVKMWQQETHEATSVIIQRGSIPLGGIHDLDLYLKKAKIGSYLEPHQLLEVSDTLRAARKIKSFFKEDEGFSILKGYTEAITTFRSIEERINECIIGENEISDHASSTLRSIRKNIENKNQAIRNRLNSMISSSQTQKFLQDAIVTIRQGRYVLPVKQEYRGNIKGLVHDQSSSGATLFIEPMAVVSLNNELKELKLKEVKEIERILLELTGLIGAYVDEIHQNQRILASLDFIFAKGRLAVAMNAIEPIINHTGFIKIKNGRHPLIDPKVVVPSNIFIGDEFSTLMITGPNTGGKTVTLKTVGLLTVMAQSGLYIPADDKSEMSVFKEVFADIGDEQSIEQSLSTFSSHMTNIVRILDHANENCLILLDELGAGTDPTEGAALAIAILDHLHQVGAKTIATTHYTELKEYALTQKGFENASVEFNVETLSPTYRLLIGVPGKSNAFEISKRLGLNEEIIEKSRNMISKEDIAFEDILTRIEKDRITAQEDRDEALRLKIMAQKQKKEYDIKSEKLSIQKDRILREAKEEGRKILREAKEEANEIIKELRSLSKQSIDKDRNRKIEKARHRLGEKMNQMHDGLEVNHYGKNLSAPPKNLKIGDSVWILTLNQKGEVLSKPKNNGDVMVQVGIMKMSVNIKNLKVDKEEKKNIQKSGIGKIIKAKAQSIQTSIDLRGENLEDALIDTDKYLDDAYVAGLSEITIIHGKGTGVLRQGIRELLKRHKHVKSFRDGVYGEGGNGVSMVVLK